MARIRLTENEMIGLLEEIILLEAKMSLDQIYAAYYSEGKRKEVPKEAFYEIANADPTRQGDGMGKYTDWMIGLYRGGNLKLEDLNKATEYLEAFHNFKNRIQEKDIRKYGSLSELYNTVKSFIDNPDQATSKSDELRRIKADGSETVYEDNEWKVIVPHTMEAAIAYGENTKWCTAASKSENAFDNYNKDGRLYININKRTGKKYQFHFERQQFKDAADNSIERPIMKTIGLSDAVFNFYVDLFGEDAKVLKAKYGPEDVLEVINLNGYYVDAQHKQKLLKYNEDTRDYEIIYSLPDEGLHFINEGLRNKFVVVADYYAVNLFDITTMEFVFDESDEIYRINYGNFNHDYIIIRKRERDKNTYEFSETIEIFSLDEMKSVLDFDDDDAVDVKPLNSLINRTYYDNNLFAVFEHDDSYLFVVDAKSGNIVAQGNEWRPIRRMIYLDNGRRGVFRLVTISGHKIILYDGTVISEDEFRELDTEILNKYANRLSIYNYI